MPSEPAGGDEVRHSVKRDPICPWCRQRHPYGEAVGYRDGELWRCARCGHPLDAFGDCIGGKCCGWLPSFPPRVRRMEHVTSSAANTYKLNLVGIR